MNNTAFRKTIENIKNHIDTNFITTERRKNNLVSKQHNQKIKVFRTFISNRNEKTKVVMNKPVLLGLFRSQ